jgi:ubiquinone/menaquinone biosynthesis C-methylase UbiE
MGNKTCNKIKGDKMPVNQTDLASNEYDDWSCYYDKCNNEIKSIVKQIGSVPWLGKRVLEIGCGTGRFTEKILPDVAELTAVDVDNNRLKILKKKVKSNGWKKKCRVFWGELYEVAHEIENKKFDCVLFSWSWRFIHQQGKADRVYKVLKKMLAEEFSILSTMTIGGEWENTIDLIVGTKEENREVTLNRMAMNYLIGLFEAENLCFSDFKQINYFEFPDKVTAQKYAFKMSGVNISEYERIGEILSKFIESSGRVRLSDEIKCLFATSANWKMP